MPDVLRALQQQHPRSRVLTSAVNPPRCLPCGHTICVYCLEQIKKAAEGAASCPVCRHSFSPTIQLPKNFSILELVEGPAAARALSSGFLHGNEKNEVPGVSPAKLIMWCDVHKGKKIKFFCITCEKKVCSKCFATEHVGHTLERPMLTRILSRTTGRSRTGTADKRSGAELQGKIVGGRTDAGDHADRAQ